MRTPCIQASSPTLTTAVSECRCDPFAGELAQAEQMPHARAGTRAADSADENGDLHTDRHSASGHDAGLGSQAIWGCDTTRRVTTRRNRITR